MNNKELSKKEQEVAEYLRVGLTPLQVAKRLNKSYQTVRTQIKSIYLKMGVNTLQQFLIKSNREQGAALEDN